MHTKESWPASKEVAHTSNPELMRVRQKDHPEVRWAILIPCFKRKKKKKEVRLYFYHLNGHCINEQST